MGECTNSLTTIGGNCNQKDDGLAGGGGWPVATGAVLQDFLALTILSDGGKFASIKRLRNYAADGGRAVVPGTVRKRRVLKIERSGTMVGVEGAG